MGTWIGGGLFGNVRQQELDGLDVALEGVEREGISLLDLAVVMAEGDSEY